MSLRRTTPAGRIASLGLVLGSMVLGLALAGPATALQDKEKRKDDREKAGPLDLAGQKARLAEWEAAWREAFEQIFSEKVQASNEGLVATGALLDDIHRNRDRITFVELRLRMERVEKQIQGEWPKIKWKMLEQFQKQGLSILTEMNTACKKHDYDAVVKMFDAELKPTAERMITADEDFIDVAVDLLAQGEALEENARVGLEIRTLELEVVGIVVEDDRTVLIRNGKEPPPADAPEGWKPAPRKYGEGDTILGVEGMVIRKIHGNKVECVWKSKYKVDLPLAR